MTHGGKTSLGGTGQKLNTGRPQALWKQQRTGGGGVRNKKLRAREDDEPLLKNALKWRKKADDKKGSNALGWTVEGNEKRACVIHGITPIPKKKKTSRGKWGGNWRGGFNTWGGKNTKKRKEKRKKDKMMST